MLISFLSPLTLHQSLALVKQLRSTKKNLNSFIVSPLSHRAQQGMKCRDNFFHTLYRVSSAFERRREKHPRKRDEKDEEGRKSERDEV